MKDVDEKKIVFKARNRACGAVVYKVISIDSPTGEKA